MSNVAEVSPKGSDYKHHLDGQFPGERIQGVPVPRSADMANVRRGLSSPSQVPWLLPDNRRMIERRLTNYRQNRFNREVASERNELSRRIRETYNDKAKGNELAAYREFELTNEVLAMPFGLGSFQQINLSADELPLIRRPAADKHFNVRIIGQDGGARKDQWRTSRSAEMLEMEMISTDRVEYPISDIQIGSVEEFDRINDRLRYDMEMYIDNVAKLAIDAAQTNSGLRALLNLHPFIIPANIPDTNYLDLTDVPTYGTANRITLTRLKAILSHMAKWGVGVDADGAVNITTMLISPQNVQDFWEFVDLVSGFTGGPTPVDPKLTVPTGVREELWNTGMMNSAWGMSWNTQANARLDIGRLYVLTDQPLGWMFTKTDFDRMIRWEGPDEMEQNYGEVLYQRVLRFVVPDLWKYRILIVDF